MPVTKTAKRALRSSKKKAIVNKKILIGIESAIKKAKKTKIEKNIRKAISLVDRAKKKKVIHKNKAARIKSTLTKLLPQKKNAESSKKYKK